MKCSFIVSAYNRPDHLAVCLGSLRIQTERDFEVLVTDNQPDAFVSLKNKIDAGWGMIIEKDSRFKYHNTALRDCYESANWGALQGGSGYRPEIVGNSEYLCFPSDDSYYPPRFLELMFRHGEGADLIYCNMVWDGRGYGPGEECIALVTAPITGKIDKSGFLIRRSVFPGFPPPGPDGKLDRCADGQLIEQVVRAGASVKKVDIFGVFHS